MEGDVPETKGGVSCNLLQSHNEKKSRAMKAPRAVKRVTFNPGETLCMSVWPS